MDSGLSQVTLMSTADVSKQFSLPASAPSPAEMGAAKVLHAEDGGKNGHVVSFKAVGWGSAQLKLL